MKKLEAYVKSVETQLETWNARIAALLAQAQKSAAEPGREADHETARLHQPSETVIKKIHAQVEKMETQLKQWAAKLDELVDAADKADAEAKLDYRKSMDNLKAKHRVALEKLAELKAVGHEKWEMFEAGVEGAWKELESAFRALTRKLDTEF